jgi:ribosomal subunit interface protein
MTEIQYTGRNINVGEHIKQYMQEKIGKHEKLLEKSTSISAIIERNKAHKGVDQDLRIELTISMPSAFIKVDEHGSNLNEMIDKLEVTLKRRLTRYHEHFQRWEKKIPWKEHQIQDTLEKAQGLEEAPADNEYAPRIRHKEYEDERPLHPAEAVEQMELLGLDCFLFRSIESNKYAMIHKLGDMGYELIEPKLGK